MRRFWLSIRDSVSGLFLLTLLLMIPGVAIAIAEWSNGLWILPTIAILSLLTNYLLALSSFSELVALFFSTTYGVFSVIMLTGRLLPESFTFREHIFELVFRINVWVENAITGGFSQDNLIFIVLLEILFWYLSFNAAWNTFRESRVWRATIPPGLALLINNYYYFGKARLDLLLIAYLFLTFTLAVRTNVVAREWFWKHKRVGYTPGIRFDFLRAGMIAIVVLLVAAWAAPAASASNELSSIWDRSRNPWYRVQDSFNRLFGALEGGRAVTADYYGGPLLSMGGPVNLGNNLVMYVYAPKGYRYYWRSKLFDIYGDGRWITSTDVLRRSDFGLLDSEQEDAYALRSNVQQRFELAMPATRLVYAAPQPISFASLPVSYDFLFTSGDGAYGVVTAVRANNILHSGDSYGATSSISAADETSLRQDSTDYPAWVVERYLQLPDTITGRTVELAARLVAPYDNPYDQTRAIEGYLRDNITYNEQVLPPPGDAEPVDHLLFETQEGYCNYYASAMVVMLRSQGIPARIAAGFTQGAFDPELDAYRVTEADAHTWVEVYFPSYGWVEFEPTANEQPITRVAERPSGSAAGADFLREPPQPDGGLSEGERFDDRAPLLPEEPEATGLLALLGLGPGFRVPTGIWIALGGAAVLGLGILGLWFWIEQRGLRGLSDVSQSYARLNIYAPRVGVVTDPGATPYERAHRLIGAVPLAEEPIRAIVQLYVGEQYAPAPPTDLHRDKYNMLAKEAWQEARGAFRRGMIRHLLARMSPFKGKGVDAPDQSR